MIGHSTEPPLNPTWTSERRKPKGKEAAEGRMGTIAQCVAGDVVACESLDRKRIIYLAIAWQWRDGKAAQVRLWDFRAGGISCCAKLLRTVQATQRVRWMRVRVK